MYRTRKLLNNLLYAWKKRIYLINNQKVYRPIVYFKDQKVYNKLDNLLYSKKMMSKKDTIKNKRVYASDLVNPHNSYITAINKLDIFDYQEINNIKSKSNYSTNLNNNYISNNIVSEVKRNNRLIKFFNSKIYIHKFNNITSKYRVDNKIVLNKYRVNNIIEEHDNEIKSRKVSNNLLMPHFFFTSRYIEKSMPSQIKHWTSSAYTFLKIHKSILIFKDIYTSEWIDRFFSLKSVLKKQIYNFELLNGINIKTNESIIEKLNELIKYTSNRTTFSIKGIELFSSIIFTYDWLKEQIEKSSFYHKLHINKNKEISGGYFPKSIINTGKYKPIISISKPIFKHTSHNLIIDLFIVNDKSNNSEKLKNIIFRRSIYKYIYGLYYDYLKKVENTVNRPKFFYINLIEPKIYYYYRHIIDMYQDLLIRNNKALYIYISMLILKKNFLYLYLNKKNNINENQFNNNFFFQKKKSENKHINNINIYINNRKLLDKDNEGINKTFSNKASMFNLLLKKIKKTKSSNVKYKKYFEELDRKSNTNLNLNSLTLWNRKGLSEEIKKYNNYNINRVRKYGKDKFSYNEYKRKHFYVKGKGNKKRIDPKIWEKKLLSFNLYSKKQKRDTTTSKKFYTEYKNRWKFDNFNSKSHINMPSNNNKINYCKNINNLSSDKNILKGEYIVKIANKTKEDTNKEIKYFDKLSMHGVEDYVNNEIYNNEFINKMIFSESKKGKYIFIKNFIKFVKFNTKIKEVKNLSIKENKAEIVNYLQSRFNQGNNLVNVINIKKYNINSLLNDNFSNHYNKKHNVNYIKGKNSFNPYEYNLKIFNTSKKKEKLFNSKIIWDKLDYSLISLLNRIFMFNDKSISKLSQWKFNYFYENTKNLFIYSNIWYVTYSISYLKSEFNTVLKDVFISKLAYLNDDSNNNKTDGYIYSENKNSYFQNHIFDLKNKKGNIKFNFFSSYIENSVIDNIKMKLPYREKLFKPYYRNILSLYIIESYKYFMKQFLGYGELFFSTNIFINKNMNFIFKNNYLIYNFIVVRTLLNLLRYNYRSLIRVKPKLYYLNKLRYYEIKFNTLNYSSWFTTIKYIKTLRKSPLNFWSRYHKVAYYYIKRITQNSELDTKRKIFVPFVIYVEDVFFSIYGKWAILRLWPLKSIILSSYILAKRVLYLIYWKFKNIGIPNPYINYSLVTSKLCSAIKAMDIQKVYDKYIYNYSNWPKSMVDIMNNKKLGNYLNYENLEFIDSYKKIHTLNIYSLVKNNLSNYLSNIDSHYLSNFLTLNKKDNLNDNSLYYNNMKNNYLLNPYITILDYTRLFLKPFKNYLYELNKSSDITGLRCIFKGRVSNIRSNTRKAKLSKLYGSLKGPTQKLKHLDKRMTKPVSRSRGYIKSNIDYGIYFRSNRNGAVSIKIWLSSRISSDVQELLLHLLHIKNLYTQLINKHYLVYSKLSKIHLYYL